MHSPPMLKYLLITFVGCVVLSSYHPALKWFGDKTIDPHDVKKIRSITDSLPRVFPKNHPDFIADKLKLDAALGFGVNQLHKQEGWEKHRIALKNEIIKKTGVIINHNLALNIKETGTIQMKGLTVIKKITFKPARIFTQQLICIFLKVRGHFLQTFL